jgi:hypothetical protein
MADYPYGGIDPQEFSNLPPEERQPKARRELADQVRSGAERRTPSSERSKLLGRLQKIEQQDRDNVRNLARLQQCILESLTTLDREHLDPFGGLWNSWSFIDHYTRMDDEHLARLSERIEREEASLLELEELSPRQLFRSAEHHLERLENLESLRLELSRTLEHVRFEVLCKLSHLGKSRRADTDVQAISGTWIDFGQFLLAAAASGVVGAAAWEMLRDVAPRLWSMAVGARSQRILAAEIVRLAVGAHVNRPTQIEVTECRRHPEYWSASAQADGKQYRVRIPRESPATPIVSVDLEPPPTNTSSN